MIRQRFLSTIVGMGLLIVLLFGVGPFHSTLAAASMPNMGKQMAPSLCQNACTSQQLVAAPVSHKKEGQDKEPQPAEPYYLIFKNACWATAIAAPVTYLHGYLRWRPPDLYKLNVNYRF